MELASKLELHYYFDDDSHTMDAYIRNKCESELLALITEIKSTLDIDFALDAEALKEGSIRNLWKILGENGVQIAAITSIIAVIMTMAQMYQSQDDEMDIELKKLSIEEKKLAIEKLKRELKSGETTNQTITEAAKCLNNDFKVLTRKSNFYKLLNGYEKVNGLGISTLTKDERPVFAEAFIPKYDFHKYILTTNELPDELVENAEIEIVSPVLKDGRYRWKGIYNDQPISFTMGDSEFKNSVLTKQVSFQNGATIVCVLKISRELDEAGEIEIVGYTVKIVISKTDGLNTEETQQGKKYKHSKKFIAGQDNLFE